MTTAAWSSTWHDDLSRSIRDMRCASLTSFAEARPSATYHELATELSNSAGREFAPVQIEHSLRDEAIDTGQLSKFARHSLVRHLRKIMSRGWRDDDDGKFEFSHAIGAWISRLPPDCEAHCTRVAAFISKSPPPNGWLPDSPADPLITDAFDKAWLVSETVNARVSTSQLFCPNCTAVLTPPAESDREQVCFHCGHRVKLR